MSKEAVQIDLTQKATFGEYRKPVYAAEVKADEETAEASAASSTELALIQVLSTNSVAGRPVVRVQGLNGNADNLSFTVNGVVHPVEKSTQEGGVHEFILKPVESVVQ